MIGGAQILDWRLNSCPGGDGDQFARCSRGRRVLAGTPFEPYYPTRRASIKRSSAFGRRRCLYPVWVKPFLRQVARHARG